MRVRFSLNFAFRQSSNPSNMSYSILWTFRYIEQYLKTFTTKVLYVYYGKCFVTHSPAKLKVNSAS